MKVQDLKGGDKLLVTRQARVTPVEVFDTKYAGNGQWIVRFYNSDGDVSSFKYDGDAEVTLVI